MHSDQIKAQFGICINRIRDFRRRWLTRRNPIIAYAFRLKNLFLEALFLMMATWALCAILFYIAFLFWQLYLCTPMGQKFCLSFPGRADTIVCLLSQDSVRFPGHLTLVAFLISMGIAAVARVMHIHRHFFLSLGLIGKLLFWGIPLTMAVAYYIHEAYMFSDWEVTALVAAVPTYLLFISCFKYAEYLLPEMEDVMVLGRLWGKRVWREVHIWMDKLARL